MYLKTKVIQKFINQKRVRIVYSKDLKLIKNNNVVCRWGGGLKFIMFIESIAFRLGKRARVGGVPITIARTMEAASLTLPHAFPG